MRGLKRMRSACTIAAGHAFVQNLRRGHYAITADLRVHDRVRDAFERLAWSLRAQARACDPILSRSACAQRNSAHLPPFFEQLLEQACRMGLLHWSGPAAETLSR